MALHAADAHGANLFLVRQYAHSSVLGSGQVQDGLQLGVGADPVIVAVGTQQSRSSKKLLKQAKNSVHPNGVFSF